MKGYTMSILDNLIEHLVEKNVIDVSGKLTVTLIEGGIKIHGTVVSTLRDEKRDKALMTITAPVHADLLVPSLEVKLQPSTVTLDVVN